MFLENIIDNTIENYVCSACHGCPTPGGQAYLCQMCGSIVCDLCVQPASTEVAPLTPQSAASDEWVARPEWDVAPMTPPEEEERGPPGSAPASHPANPATTACADCGSVYEGLQARRGHTVCSVKGCEIPYRKYVYLCTGCSKLACKECMKSRIISSLQMRWCSYALETKMCFVD